MEDIDQRDSHNTIKNLHEIATVRQKRYNKWYSVDVQSMSSQDLSEEVNWWKREVRRDIQRSKHIPEDDTVAYTAIIVNMAHASMIHSAVQQEYIKKLEDELKGFKHKKR